MDLQKLIISNSTFALLRFNFTTKFDLKQTKADVLISGLLILRDILFYLKIDEIVVSDCGVREGVVLELIGE